MLQKAGANKHHRNLALVVDELHANGVVAALPDTQAFHIDISTEAGGMWSRSRTIPPFEHTCNKFCEYEVLDRRVTPTPSCDGCFVSYLLFFFPNKATSVPSLPLKQETMTIILTTHSSQARKPIRRFMNTVHLELEKVHVIVDETDRRNVQLATSSVVTIQ